MRAGQHAPRRHRTRRRPILIATLILAAGAASVAVALLPSGRHSHQDASTSSIPSTSSTSPTTQAPPPTTGLPPPTTLPDPLGAAATAYLSTRQGTVTAAVEDMGTGQLWTLGDSPPQAEASIVKVDILAALLRQQPGGAALPAATQTLAQSMIEQSDNDAATDLWNAVGGARGIRTFNDTVGMSSTTPSLCVTCPNFPWPGWGLTTTTPLDQIALLKTLVTPNSILTTSQRSYALGLMEHVTPSERWGITGGVPAQATVALKNGWLPLNDADTDWQINSIGWVSDTNHDYLIAVLSTGNPTEQYGIDTIDGLSAIIWQATATA